MISLQGKTALITGASDGIGETIAARLFADGAAVVLCARSGAAVRDRAQALDPSGTRASHIACDVRDPESVERAVKHVVDKYGGLHIAVNNAGITGPGATPIVDLDVDAWNDVLATDLTGMFYSLKYEIPALIAAGGGAIVNMSSANGCVGLAGLAAYTAAKHGVIGLTRSAALELAGAGIRVNAVAPGYVDTPKMQRSPEPARQAMARSHPLSRFATRDEVAALVAYLVSDASAFCTGGVYPIDGGYTAR